MAILQVRGIGDRLYDTLKQRAHIHDRSISQEVISILEKHLSAPDAFNTHATREFLNLSWEDNRSADEIIADIGKGRKNKTSFGKLHGIFY
jgi:plasmid stability protein